MENKKYKFRYYYGLVAFFASIVLLIFVCAPLQLYFGMAGLAATELILLLLAVGSALLAKKLTGTGFKEIFPLKVPDAGQIIGAVMVYFGGYMLMLAAAYLSMFFMPETAERAAQLSDFTTTVPFPLAILITAVMPAVCEEALHRGFIMASFRTLKDEPRLKGRTALVKVLVIGLCGLVFGLFHLDPVRLLPTAILGGVFAYMNIKTESILPSVIMHFTNNVFSVISMYAMSALQQAVPDEQLEAAMRAAESAAESSVFTNFRAVAGIAMILAGLALLLLYGGIRMLNRVKRGVGGAYAYANPDFGENPPQGYAATQEGDFPGAPGRDTYTELTSLPERISASPLAKAVAVLLTSLVLLSSGGVLIITSGALPQDRPYSFVSIFDHDRGIYEETTAAETVSAETTSSETASDEPPASI